MHDMAARIARYRVFKLVERQGLENAFEERDDGL